MSAQEALRLVAFGSSTVQPGEQKNIHDAVVE
jgi:hypothetical protein